MSGVDSTVAAEPNFDYEFPSPHSSADEEYESDEAPELKLDLQMLKHCASNMASSTCTQDFEYAYTGPLYYLYEYPIFLQDVDFSPDLYEQNAILRPHFVRALRKSFPKGSPDAIAVRDVMREKNFPLNDFPRLIALMQMDGLAEANYNSLRFFSQSRRDGIGLAYDGRMDYVPNSELDTDGN